MGAEIEVKAHVSDYKKILTVIRKTAGVHSEYYQMKSDIYFAHNGRGDKPMLRSRLEQKGPDKDHLTGSVLLTCKDKLKKDGFELNHEIEFTAPSSDFETTLAFFEALGYEQWRTKTKEGYSFVFDYFDQPLHVELIEVPPLGWFLEMEFCLEDGAEESKGAEYTAYLKKALTLFGISQDQIEDRYYIEMLTQEA